MAAYIFSLTNILNIGSGMALWPRLEVQGWCENRVCVFAVRQKAETFIKILRYVAEAKGSFDIYGQKQKPWFSFGKNLKASLARDYLIFKFSSKLEDSLLSSLWFKNINLNKIAFWDIFHISMLGLYHFHIFWQFGIYWNHITYLGPHPLLIMR